MSDETKSTTTTTSKETAKPSGIQNGKGDAPRNITEAFRANYDEISWSDRAPRVEGSKVRKVYK